MVKKPLKITVILYRILAQIFSWRVRDITEKTLSLLNSID